MTDLDEDVEEILYRVDERTQSIEGDLNDISDAVQENRTDIDNLQSKVKRNSTILNAVSVGGVAVVTWIADKLTRLYPN